MDAVKFFSELRRICKSSSDCTKCQYHGDRCDNAIKAIELFEKTVAVVGQWSQEHPRKIRQDVFLEQWPEAKLFDGIIDIKPCSLVTALRLECPKTFCYECRHKFWMQAIE